MSRRWRLLRNAGIGLAALLVLIVAAAILVMRTAGFRDFVKDKIIAAAEEGTGGRVEIGSLTIDPLSLHAVMTGFVIHGLEPAGAAPFVRIPRAEVYLRLLTGRLVDIVYLGITRPQANIMVFANGTTNVPTPKTKSTSNESSLETVIDLAIRRADLINGIATYNSMPQPLDVKANNLHVTLAYSPAEQAYRGNVSLQPVYIASGRNAPLNVTIDLPVELRRDRVDFRNARISTAQSHVRIDAAIRNLRDPEATAHVNGRLALVELQAAGNLAFNPGVQGAPAFVNLQGDVLASGSRIQVAGLRLDVGRSNIEASGDLKGTAGGALNYLAKLDLGELARLAGSAVRAEGAVSVNGAARLDAANRYDVSGSIEARNISLQQGARHLTRIDLVALLSLNPQRLTLTDFKLDAPGAEITASASLEHFARFQVDGNLRHLDIHAIALALGQPIPYSGTISGPISAQGDLNARGAQGIEAEARLSIAPAQGGVPVSGNLTAAYHGARDDMEIPNSRISLPHSTLTVNGSIGRRLNVTLVSRDLRDLLAAAPAGSAPDIHLLSGGQFSLTGAITGQLSSPRIDAHLAVDRFQVQARQFDSLALDARATSLGASVSNGVLTHSAMQAHFNGALALSDWKTMPGGPVSLQGGVRNGDLADIMAQAGQGSAGYSGAVAAQIDVAGTVGDPRGAASVQISGGEIHGEPFDAANLQAILSDRLVSISSASIYGPAGRIDLTGEYHHPAGSFGSGQIHASLRSTALQIAQLHTVQASQPGSAGQVSLNAEVTGDLSSAPGPGGATHTEFLASAVNGEVSVRALRFQSQDYGDVTASVRTSGRTVTYSLNSDFAGSAVRVDGATQLARGYPTNAAASLKRLPIERVLALANQSIPARGYLSGQANVHGTLDNPEGAVDLELTNGAVYGEPVNAIRARATYLANSIVLSQLEAVSGPSRISVTGRYDHAPGNFQAGDVQFEIAGSRLDLAHIRSVQTLRPGIAGTVEIAAKGEATLRAGAPLVTLKDLTADVSAKGISAKGKDFGGLSFTARATGGQLNFAVDSDLASAKIHGVGTAQLTAQYPVSAKLNIDNVAWARVRDLLGLTNQPLEFDAALDGCEITVNGPAMDPVRLRGGLRVARLQVRNIPEAGAPTVTVENQGPIVVALDNGVARIESLRFAAPKANLQASGSYALQTRTLNGSVGADVDLALLQQFSREIVSSGQVDLSANIRGDVSKPLINGSLKLQNASVNYLEVANGIANANGVIQFNGNSAAVRDFSASVGGGKVTLTGYANYAETLNFGLNVKAEKVLALFQPGLSAVIDSNLRLSGRQQGGLLTGDVTVEKITYAPTSDLGSILSRATPQAQTGSSSSFLNNMKLDVQVRTSPSLIVQSAVAENLTLAANLRVRGAAAQPGAQGRVTISSGQLLFFGSTYAVNAGSISFFNPLRIDPILDLSLATQAQGVAVTLRVTGPVDNMALSYTSNPPLEFEQIVNLLAAGKTPTTDPNLLANQPVQAPQTFQQMGESAILGQTVAGPVADRLKRVFGVNQLNISPAFTGGSYLPEAQITLQQNITNAITFTYTTAVNDPNTQIVRVQWAFNPRWSSVAMRDQNGIVSVRLLYKKQFR